MLRGAQRCSSFLTRQLAGRAATLTQSQILPASLAPLAVLRTTLAADAAPAGAGSASSAFHGFPTQSIHTSVSSYWHFHQMIIATSLIIVVVCGWLQPGEWVKPFPWEGGIACGAFNPPAMSLCW